LNTKYKILLLGFVCLINSHHIFGQNNAQYGLLTTLNVNHKFETGWALNSKLETRQIFKTIDRDGIINKDYQYVLTDISLIAAKKIGLNARITSGYLMRFREGEIFYRFIQQYTIVQRMNGFRLAHRFSSDQTFSKTDPLDFRLRYRITSEIPLSGQSVDTKEFYIKFNNEYVNSWQSKNYDLEIRLIPLLGYGLSPNNKIELGLDYRISSFLSNDTDHSFWMSLNWFLEL
jgi:hypothetical protein